MNYPKIESERLLLRQLELSDIDDIVEGLSNKDVSKYVSMAPYPFTKENAEQYITDGGKRFRRANDVKYYHWGIVLKSENKVIGAVRFEERGGYMGIPSPSATTEIWINQYYKGNEYGLESKCLMADYAFNVLGMESIISKYLGENIASHKMNERSGAIVFDADGGKVIAYITRRNWNRGRQNNPHYDRIKKYIPQTKVQERRR